MGRDQVAICKRFCFGEQWKCKYAFGGEKKTEVTNFAFRFGVGLERKN